MVSVMVSAFPTLTVIGDVCVDLTMGPLGDWPAIGTETLMDEYEVRPGGSAGNTVLAMEYIGRPCILISAVGDDHFGRWLTRCYKRCDGRFNTREASTTLSVCLSHSCSERTILTTRGHLEHMDSSDVLRFLKPAERCGDTVLLAGVFLLPNLRAEYPSLLERITAAGYDIAIDTGWPNGGWAPETRSEVMHWLPRCSHLLINETEALGLSGERDLEKATQKIRQRLPSDSRLIVKRGSRGAVGIDRDGTVTVAAKTVVVRDSIGAGDTFNAGYLDTWLRGSSLRASLQAGCDLASTVISRNPRNQITNGELATLVEQPDPERIAYRKQRLKPCTKVQ